MSSAFWKSYNLCQLFVFNPSFVALLDSCSYFWNEGDAANHYSGIALCLEKFPWWSLTVLDVNVLNPETWTQQVTTPSFSHCRTRPLLPNRLRDYYRERVGQVCSSLSEAQIQTEEELKTKPPRARSVSIPLLWPERAAENDMHKVQQHNELFQRLIPSCVS